MKCERCQEWIREAALGPLDASWEPRLKAHLAECAGCRASFEAERRLLAAIDRGLAASLDGKPSSEFAACVRIRLAEEGERARLRPWWMPGAWIPVSVAALATLLFTLWSVQRPPQPRRQRTQATAPSGPSHTVAPKELAKVAAPPGAGSLPLRSSRTAREVAQTRKQRQAGRETQALQLQVLVEPGQWAAITALYRATQSGHLETSSPAQEKAGDGQSVEVNPVEIQPLAIAELYPPDSARLGRPLR